MPVLTLPDPCVVVLVGAAGAGKSTLAARLFRPDEVLSSDAYRAIIAGDAADQRATAAAFRAIGRELERRLAAGRLTVIDATNVSARDRRPWLLAARRHRVPAVALVLDLPPNEVLAQNAARQRLVDPEVVRRHLDRVRRTVDAGALEREGFDIVAVIRSTGARDALLVRRAPRAVDDRPPDPASAGPSS